MCDIFVFTNHLESLFSKSPSEDYMQMICTVYYQSRYRSFSSKIIPSYNPYLANFSLLVVKIPKLLAKWVKCPFSYGEIYITVCGRGGIMLILLCPLEKGLSLNSHQSVHLVGSP